MLSDRFRRQADRILRSSAFLVLAALLATPLGKLHRVAHAQMIADSDTSLCGCSLAVCQCGAAQAAGKPPLSPAGDDPLAIPAAPNGVMVDLAEPTFGVPFAPASVAANLGGYIDSAVIQTRIRMRYDNFQGADFPTRADYIYPTPFDRGGPGPDGGGTSREVDFQELNTYVEMALSPNFSVFGSFPVRWVSFVDVNNATGADDGQQVGAGDVRAGLRYALYSCDDTWLTAQARFLAPTGDASRALGIGHSAIDVALLFQTRLDPCWTLFGEIQDWQSLDHERIANATDPTLNGQPLNGNVLRVGLGASKEVWQQVTDCHDRRLSFVVEMVGWSVLDGFATDLSGTIDPVDANGDTIFNGKYGIRYVQGNDSLYLGYGHPFTDDKWYSDMLRVEWARNF